MDKIRQRNYCFNLTSKFSRLLLLSVLSIGICAQMYGRGAGIVSKHGRLQVKNARVCAEDGTQISLGGMSFFWSNWAGQYYNASMVNYLVDNFQVSIVRAAYGCPENSGPDGDYSKIYAVVDAAINRGIYVIIDWHTEGNAWNYTSQAEAFFRTMAQKYGNTPNVIYEPYNEPKDVQGTATIKDWCQRMRNIIRQYDPDNLIICGSTVWSQYPNSYSISDNNIAYTFHGYFDDPGNGANHRSQFYTNVAAAMNMGNAVFVTEYGSHYGSNSGTNEIINKCQEWGISMCAWSVNDKDEPWSIFCPGSGSSCVSAIGNFYKSKLTTWPDASGGGGGGGGTTCTTVDITGTIEAENYCQKSEVETEACSEGGSNVGWIDAGDWMTYSVNVPSAGSYTIKYRVAGNGGKIQLEKGGGSVVYGQVDVTPTSGWQNWTTVSHTVTLPAGKQDIAIKAITGGFNLNWWGQANGGGGGGGSDVVIQAESYAAMNGVQKETTTDAGGGQNVGWIDAGDWMSYTSNPVTISTAGIYKVEFRVASAVGGGSLQFEEAGGSPVYGNVGINNTGGWQNWTSVFMNVNLSAGTHKFGIKALAGGWNINWFKIIGATKSGMVSEDIHENDNSLLPYPNPCYDKIYLRNTNNENTSVEVMDLSGKILIRKQLNSNVNEISVSHLKSGMYFVRVNSGSGTSINKILKR